MLLQTNLYNTNTMMDYSSGAAVDPQLAAITGGLNLLSLVFGILSYFALAKIFIKAGMEWWKALIPFYNIYLLFKLVNKPGWWLILLFIPFVNVVVYVLMTLGLAKAFGKGSLFALGLIFLSPIFMLILALDSSTYQLQGNSQSAMANGSMTSGTSATDTTSSQQMPTDNMNPQNPQTM